VRGQGVESPELLSEPVSHVHATRVARRAWLTL
jgi:hypothetical protein